MFNINQSRQTISNYTRIKIESRPFFPLKLVINDYENTFFFIEVLD